MSVKEMNMQFSNCSVYETKKNGHFHFQLWLWIIIIDILHGVPLVVTQEMTAAGRRIKEIVMPEGKETDENPRENISWNSNQTSTVHMNPADKNIMLKKDMNEFEDHTTRLPMTVLAAAMLIVWIAVAIKYLCCRKANCKQEDMQRNWGKFFYSK